MFVISFNILLLFIFNLSILVFVFSFYLKTLFYIEYGKLNTCVKHFIWILSE